MLREALGMEYNTDKNLTNTSKLGRWGREEGVKNKRL